MTKEKFEAYVKVQASGRTNMFAVGTVMALADVPLTKEDCFDIMENYSKYEKEYGVSVDQFDSELDDDEDDDDLY